MKSPRVLNVYIYMCVGVFSLYEWFSLLSLSLASFAGTFFLTQAWCYESLPSLGASQWSQILFLLSRHNDATLSNSHHN